MRLFTLFRGPLWMLCRCAKAIFGYNNIEGNIEKPKRRCFARIEIMTIEIAIKTTVLPGGKIEISTPQLVAGQQATVIVRVEDEQPEKLTITERLARANYHGGTLFKTAEEIDAYIREERDSWER
jgi:hypothetical protein